MITTHEKSRQTLVVVVLLAICIAMAGCSPATRTPVAAEKTGTGQRRVDTEPLTQRFPLIGDPVRVVWYSGTTGSGGAPGPSTYWIDAVITLDAATAAQIRDSYDLKPTNDVPEVADQLKPDIPSGLWASAELNTALVQGGDPPFTASAYYSPSSQQIVICAVGQ